MKIMIIACLFGLILFGNFALQDAADKSEKSNELGKCAKVVLLHHSTGDCIWKGGISSWFKDYNKTNKTKYKIYEKDYPKKTPYGWKNYPYDYWNIWVKMQERKNSKTKKRLRC